MTSSTLIFVSLVFGVLTTSVNAQFSCPPDPNPTICYCHEQSNGLEIECYGYYSPETIKSRLAGFSSYGPIAKFSVTFITQSYFSHVIDDFLSGNEIPNVNFVCTHGQSVDYGHLTFSANPFNDQTGKCGLTGNLTITDCNIRQFNAAILNNCNQLEKWAFMNSHVDNITEIPTLTSLTNFTVYYPYQWSGTSQRGLSLFSLASGALLPRLRYLDLSGNSLTPNEIAFISEQTIIEEMHLEGNNLYVVPVLTDFTVLHTFSSSLNGSNTEVSIQLPNPRVQSRSLTAKVYSNSTTTIFNVTSIQGLFTPQDSLYLNMNMDEFNEEAFLAPLESGLNIYLNSSSRISCACKISWLVRDNPELLSQVFNGYCIDGRPFASVTQEEVVCCSNKSLIKRIDRQEEEIYRLRAANKQLRSAMESCGNAGRLSEL